MKLETTIKGQKYRTNHSGQNVYRVEFEGETHTDSYRIADVEKPFLSVTALRSYISKNRLAE